MGRRKKFVVQESHLERNPEIIVDGFLITHGDMIKIKGVYGGKFKFDYFVTNTKTGAQWVDCFEIFRGGPSTFRAFKLERIKRIPVKRGRGKRVNRSETN